MDVLARQWLLVKLSVLVASFDTPTGIAEQDLHALTTAQILLILPLYALLADVVTWLIVVVLLNVAL